MAEVLHMDLQNITRWTELTQKMQDRMQDLSPIFEAADSWFRGDMKDQFESQGAFLQGGVEWTPLSPEYAKRKPEPPAPFGILYRSGDLYRSLALEGGDHIKQVGTHEGIYGSSVPYGRYHQDGTGKMPQRKIIIVLNKLRQRLARTTLTYLKSGRSPGASEE
jgi:phage gpG-like protein